MIISDLTYLGTATEANILDGGIVSYTAFAFFAQHLQGINSGAVSGPTGAIAGVQVIDTRTLTFGGLTVTF
jgi:hypothetical protein